MKAPIEARRGGRRRWLTAALVVLAGFAVAAGVYAWRQLSHPSLAPYASLAMKPLSGQSGGLSARFFGTTSIEIDDGETAIMTDGFFSRPGIWSVMFGEVAPDPQRIDATLKRGEVSKLAAVLASHSHYDHALDSAVVAERTAALLVGSSSTANIGRGAGLGEDRLRIVKGGDKLELGGFVVEFFATPHSGGNRYPGEITEPLRPPAKVTAYKEGGSYSFLLHHPRGTILIVPSANFIPGLFKNVKADVVFLGIGGLGRQPEEFVRDYWREVVSTTGAKLVIPIHWDDFTLPLDQPVEPAPALMGSFDAAMKLVLELARANGVAVRFPPLFEPVELLPLGPH